MKKWIKLGVVCLVVFSTTLIGLSYAKQVWYGDLRDYYPFGLYIETRKLDHVPVNYTVIEDDIYIEQALTSGELTWVQQDNPNSTFVSQGCPEDIFWVPDGSYYRASRTYIDGVPESWKLLPPPVEMATLQAIPWTVFLAALGVARFRNRMND